jgi:hypothetical protein
MYLSLVCKKYISAKYFNESCIHVEYSLQIRLLRVYLLKRLFCVSYVSHIDQEFGSSITSVMSLYYKTVFFDINKNGNKTFSITTFLSHAVDDEKEVQNNLREIILSDMRSIIIPFLILTEHVMLYCFRLTDFYFSYLNITQENFFQVKSEQDRLSRNIRLNLYYSCDKYAT